MLNSVSSLHEIQEQLNYLIRRTLPMFECGTKKKLKSDKRKKRKYRVHVGDVDYYLKYGMLAAFKNKIYQKRFGNQIILKDYLNSTLTYIL